jgi:hypothetical protein
MFNPRMFKSNDSQDLSALMTAEGRQDSLHRC